MTAKASVDWAAVKRDYLASELTVEQIAAKYGTNTTRIHSQRAAEDWPKRSETRGFGGARFGQNLGSPEATPTRIELAARLMKTIDRKLKQMEKRMSKGDGSDASPAESERDARALANLTRALDQASEMIAGERGSDGQGDGKQLETTSNTDAADALRLRRELAERIERLAKRGED